MSAPRAFVPPEVLAAAAPGEHLGLEGDVAHHLTRVLRLGPGDSCGLFDGAGREAQATLERVARTGVTVRLEAVRTAPPLPGPPLELLVATLKADKLDWVVQKATELGVDRIVPVRTARSVARPEADAAPRRHERLQRILREAGRQCGRAYLPALGPPVPLEAALGDGRVTGALALVCWEEAAPEARFGAALDGALAATRVRILVGPEGGLTAEEVALAGRYDFRSVSLGTLILRAETAAIAACALASAHLGRLG